MPARASRHDHFPRADLARRTAIRHAVSERAAAWTAIDTAPDGLLAAIDAQADAPADAAIAALHRVAVMVDKAGTDFQLLQFGIIIDAVGKTLGCRGNRAILWDRRAAPLGHARRSRRVPVGKALAETVQPYHLAPQLGRLGELRRIGGQRHAQAGAHQIIAEGFDIVRMREQRRDIGKDIHRIDRRAIGLGEFGKHVGRDIGFGRGGVFPEGENAAAPASIVMLIGNRCRQRCGRTTRRS